MLKLLSLHRLLCVWALLLIPAIASAHSPVHPETRVGDFEVAAKACVRLSVLANSSGHQANDDASTAEAVGYPHATKGAGRAAKSCFVAGTLVLTKEGKKPIEDVEAGDEVWSYDLSSGEWRWSVVTRRMVHDYQGELVTFGSPGSEVTATANHPFCVGVDSRDVRARPLDIGDDPLECAAGGRWVAAGDVLAGDYFFGVDGSHPVSLLSGLEASLLVYNLEVEGAHTYVVGGEELLVHNKGMVRKRPKTKGANRLDRKQVDAVARQAGIQDRRGFGKFIEAEKRAAGRGGSDNFTFDELVDLAEEFGKHGH